MAVSLLETIKVSSTPPSQPVQIVRTDLTQIIGVADLKRLPTRHIIKTERLAGELK